MKTIFKILLTITLLVCIGSAVHSAYTYMTYSVSNDESYELSNSKFTKPVRYQKDSKTILFLKSESIFIKNDKKHCIQKVMFANFTTGYIGCGHTFMEDVYYTYGNENLPPKMHFTREELNL